MGGFEAQTLALTEEFAEPENDGVRIDNEYLRIVARAAVWRRR